MTLTTVPVAARTALLLVDRPEAAGLEAIVRGLGYLPSHIAGADQVAERVDASLVYSVGKVIVLFRPKPDAPTDEADN